MASIKMSRFIDSTFQSVPAQRISRPGGYDAEGIYVPGTPVITNHKVTIQPVSDKEIQSLDIGAERTNDVRKIYVNDGELYSIAPSDDWTFTGITGTFKTIVIDVRPWRDYAKVVVSRRDDV